MNNRFAIPATLAIVVFVLGLQGCKQSGNQYDATVQGSVTIDGELAHSGTVTFNPAKKGPVATGRVFENGSYTIRTGQGDLSDPDRGSIMSGEYVVTVTVTGPPDTERAKEEGGPPAAGPRLMADKYAAKDTSDLKFTVKPGANVINLKLDGPWANPPKEEEEQPADANAPSDAAGGAAADDAATESPAEAATDSPPTETGSGSAAPGEAGAGNNPVEGAPPDEGAAHDQAGDDAGAGAENRP